MKKKWLVIAILIIVAAAIAFSVIQLRKVLFARKIEASIAKEDYSKAIALIEAHPDCINNFPTVLPDFVRSAFSIYHTYPFISACSTGNAELVKAFVENGVNVNCKDDCTPIECVYRDKPNGWFELSEYLIENGADVTMITDRQGRSTVLESIVRFSAELDPSEKEKMHSAFYSAYEATQNMPTNYELVYCYCADEDDIDLLEFLSEKGIGANSSYNGMTALMFAALGGNGSAVEYLIAHGASVNDSDDGWTALLYAAKSGTPKSILLLLDAGADKTVVSPDGKTPYELSLENKKLTQEINNKLI